MAQSDRTGAANLHGLARVQRERRWLVIMDSVLVLSLALWVASLTLTDRVPASLGWVMPVVTCVVGAHRVLVSVERHRRDRAGAEVVVPRQLSRAGR
jgi:uncharacterized membrane-anchored protein